MAQQIAIPPEAARMLHMLQVPEKLVFATWDILVQILRSHQLERAAKGAKIVTQQPQDGGPVVHFDYRLDVTPEQAAQMNWELSEKLASDELYRDGVVFGFVGEKAGHERLTQ